MNRLHPWEIGLIAAALALIADQGSKLFMLYGAGFAVPFFRLQAN